MTAPETPAPPAPQPQQWFTVTEVAKMFRVSKMTVHRLVVCGALSAHRIGRSIRIPASSIDAYRDASRIDT